MIATRRQREREFVLPWEQHHHRQRRRRRGAQAAAPDYVQCAKYGAGIAAGIVVVGWLKRRIAGIPVVGLLASPFLGLMPTVLLGTAVGAAVVYGIDEEGDPALAPKRLLPEVKRRLKAARQEVGELGRSLGDLHATAAREGEGAIARLASSLDAAAADAEASLSPVVRRHAATLERELQLHRAAAEAAEQPWLSQQQQRQQQRQRRLPRAGGSESGSE